MRLECRTPRRRLLISLTPLIDVVFILLLFFLLTSHFQRWQALRIDAPRTTPANAEDTEAPRLLIRLHADGRTDLDGEPLGGDVLAQRLRERLRQRPGLRVLIQPDAGVDLQTLVAALDLVVATGVSTLSLE